MGPPRGGVAIGATPAWQGGAPLGGVGYHPVAPTVLRDPKATRRRRGGFIAAVGGATIVAGSFADWVRADIRSRGILEGTGWRNVNGKVAHGPWFAALGALIAVVGAIYLVGLVPRLARWIGVMATLVSVGFATYEITDITKVVEGVTTKLQPGLIIIVVGSAIGLLGLLLTVGASPATGSSAAPGPAHGSPPPASTPSMAPPPTTLPPMAPPPSAVPPSSLPPMSLPPMESAVPPPDPTLLG